MPYGVPTNSDRADWARAALEAFGQLTGQSDYFEIKGEERITAIEEIAGDLIGDICHLLRREGINFQEVIQRGLNYHDEELLEECPQCGEDSSGGEGDGETGFCGSCADQLAALSV